MLVMHFNVLLFLDGVQKQPSNLTINSTQVQRIVNDVVKRNCPQNDSFTKAS